jgi:hypothetical protein
MHIGAGIEQCSPWQPWPYDNVSLAMTAAINNDGLANARMKIRMRGLAVNHM